MVQQSLRARTWVHGRRMAVSWQAFRFHSHRYRSLHRPLLHRPPHSSTFPSLSACIPDIRRKRHLRQHREYLIDSRRSCTAKLDKGIPAIGFAFLMLHVGPIRAVYDSGIHR